MYLLLKSLIGRIMITPLSYIYIQIRLISISLQILIYNYFSDYTCLEPLNTIRLADGGYKTGVQHLG